MKKPIFLLAFAAAIGVMGLGSNAKAADPTQTTITVSDLHCMGCAKSCAKQLYAIAGVAKIEVNVEAKTLVITPKPKAVLSPLSIWEAVEKAGKQVGKIQGPGGTVTAKPKQ